MSGASASASETGGVPRATDELQQPRKRPKLRRTTFACYRCHRRKIKCDGLKPACSNCIQAKQPCHGILDGESKTVIPRSIAAYLREKIAEKERFLQKLGVDCDEGPAVPLQPGTRPNPTSQGFPESATRYQGYDLESEAFRSFGDSCNPIIDSKTKFPFATFLFASSHLPSADPLPVNDEVREDDLKPKASNALDQISPNVKERLVALYTDRILPFYPIVERQRVWAQFHRVQSGQPASEYDIFTVSMIIAISMMTSKVNDSVKIACVSKRVFSHALQYTESLFEPSLDNVRGMLLLAQYSYLMPSIARVGDTIGLAMRMALELGLHRDLEETGIEGNESNSRRALFWVLYAYDRSTCATSYRRLGVADDSISTKYPTNMDGSFLINNIRFPRIQSEFLTVNYLRRGLPLLTEPGSFEAWIQSTENRIKAWEAEVVNERSSWGSEWFAIAAAHGLVFLHRPTPRNPHPSAESLVKCFEAATRVAGGYWRNQKAGFLKYSYHGVHHGFEASICCLFAIRHCREQLTAKYGMQQILDTLHLFSSLLAVMSKRWPQAHASLESYERCKAVIVRELMSPQATSPVKNDELDRLILPYQALIDQADAHSGLGEFSTARASTAAMTLADKGIGAGYPQTTASPATYDMASSLRLSNQQAGISQTLAHLDSITAPNTLPSMQSSFPTTPEFFSKCASPVYQDKFGTRWSAGSEYELG